MSIVRRFAVFIVVGLLTLTLLTGNIAVTSHETVLDPKFVKNTLSEEEAYDTLHETVLEDGEFPFAETDSLPPFATDIAARVVIPEYLQNQTETNVDRLYAYLHGNRDDPGIAVNLTPAFERTDEAVEATIRNTTVEEAIGTVGVESAFPPGSRVNKTLLVGLTQGPEEYEETRSEFRGLIVERLVNQSYKQLTNDARLRLVNESYNPQDFTEEEKQQRVEKREGEIRTVLREQILKERGNEIDSTIDSAGQKVKKNFGNASTGFGEEVDSAAGDFVGVLIDGLTDEDLTYEEFRTDLDDAKADLGVALGDFAQSELRATLEEQDRVEDGRIDLTGDLPADTRQQLDRAQQAIGIVDILGIALPLVALVLIGLLWLLSSVPTAALWTGVAALFAGVPGFLGATVGDTRLEQAFAANAPQSGIEGEFATLALSLVEGVLGQLGAQSLWLTAAGGLLAIAGAAVRLGLVDDPFSEDETEEPIEETDLDDSESADGEDGENATDSTTGSADAGEESDGGR